MLSLANLCAADDKVQVFYQCTSDWGAGLIEEVTISNGGITDVPSWTLEFDLPSQISNMWGGQIESHNGDHYVVKPLSWDELIYPGGRVTVGFQAAPGGMRPSNVRLKLASYPPVPPGSNARPGDPNTTLKAGDVTIAFKVNNDWHEALQADFSLTNNSSSIIKDWGLEFDLPGNIASIWNATVVSHDKTRFTINAANFDWNKDIAPGATVRFGLILQPGALHQPSLNISLIGNKTKVTPAPVAQQPAAVNPAPIISATPFPTATPYQPMKSFDYADALKKSLLFYAAQRSGKLPNDGKVPWRGDSALSDGADVGVDLTGGYYDAGDNMKFALPLCSTLTMLAWGGIEYGEGYRLAGQWDDFLGTVRWGTDWLLKAHTAPNEFYVQVGNGEADHAFWGPPERMTMARPAFKITADKPGSEVAGEAAAALASAAILFKKSDPEYAKLLLTHARQLYAFADQYRGTYSDSVPEAANFYRSYSGYFDELSWGAAWLFQATGQKDYLEKAEDIYQKHLQGTLLAQTQSWDDKRYGAAVLLALITKKPIYKTDVEGYFDYWTIGHKGRRVHYTSGGLAWQDQWGSLRYAANTAFLAFVYSDGTRDDAARLRNFAVRQMNYILGDNPTRRSYVVGFGQNSPRNPHHRAAHGSTTNSISDPPDNANVLLGALVGGPPTPDDYSYSDLRANFIANEVALDYNAGFSGALARLVMLQAAGSLSAPPAGR